MSEASGLKPELIDHYTWRIGEGAVPGMRAYDAFAVFLDEGYEILFLLLAPVAFT